MKKVKSYKKWNIYTGFPSWDIAKEYPTFYAFLPEEGPNNCDYPEIEDDNITVILEAIDNY